MLQVDDVRRAAAGRWLQILADLAPELETALSRVGRHVPCPVHGGKDGFRLFPDAETTGGGVCNTCDTFSDGFALLGWLKNWRFPEVLASVAGALQLSGSDARKKVVRVSSPVAQVPVRLYQYRSEEEDKKLCARRDDLWSESIPVTHQQALVAQRYLMRRKLPVRYAGTLHQALRFHSKVPYFDEEGKITGHYPTLLCNVSDMDGNMVTLHRTYLSPDGYKAPVESAKKLMSVPNGKTLAGCCIKLGTPTSSVLGYSEGLENALAAHAGSGTVVWAGVSATLLEQVTPPPCIKLVCGWGDRDHSGRGEAAVKKLKERLWSIGIQVQIFMPPMPIPESASGVDWNDVWVAYGHAGFPHRAMFARVA